MGMNLSSRKRQYLLYLGIFFLLVLLTGCKHLRLLQLKTQLRHSGKYIQINEQDGLRLTFNDPLLEKDDIVLLMQTTPTSETITGHNTQWRYVFQKRYVRGKEEHKNFDFAQTMSFEDGKLREIHFSPGFSSALSKTLMTGLLQAIGRGRLDDEQEQIVMRWNRNTAQAIQLPTRQAIETAWGKPYSIEQSGSESRYLYIYTVQPESATPDEPRIVLQLWLTFREDETSLLSLTGWYKSSWMSLDFSKPFQGYVSMDI